MNLESFREFCLIGGKCVFPSIDLRLSCFIFGNGVKALNNLEDPGRSFAVLGVIFNGGSSNSIDLMYNLSFPVRLLHSFCTSFLSNLLLVALFATLFGRDFSPVSIFGLISFFLILIKVCVSHNICFVYHCTYKDHLHHHITSFTFYCRVVH